MALILDMCIRAPLNWATANQRKRHLFSCSVTVADTATITTTNEHQAWARAHTRAHTPKEERKRYWILIESDIDMMRSIKEVLRKFGSLLLLPCERKPKRETETGAGCLCVKLNTLLALNLQVVCCRRFSMVFEMEETEKRRNFQLMKRFLSENPTFQNWDTNLLNFMTTRCDAFHDQHILFRQFECVKIVKWKSLWTVKTGDGFTFRRKCRKNEHFPTALTQCNWAWL